MTLVFANVISIIPFTWNAVYAWVRSGFVVSAFQDVGEIFNLYKLHHKPLNMNISL